MQCMVDLSSKHGIIGGVLFAIHNVQAAWMESAFILVPNS